MLREKLLIASLITTIVILTTIRTISINNFSVQVGEYDRLQKEIQQLRFDNTLIQSEILHYKSLHRIASESSLLDFVEPSQIIFIGD